MLAKLLPAFILRYTAVIPQDKCIKLKMHLVVCRVKPSEAEPAQNPAGSVCLYTTVQDGGSSDGLDQK